MIRGSSSIRSQQEEPGLTGPIGPTGPTGATGAIGPIGATGSIGVTGAYVIRGKYVSDQLVLVLSDGNEIPIQGLTGVSAEYEGVVTGENVGSGFHVLSTFPAGTTAGLTFSFVSITGEGNVTVTRSGDTILIGGTYEIKGVSSAVGATSQDGLVYLSSLNEISGSSSGHSLKIQRSNNNSFDFFGGSGATGALLTEKNNIQNLGPIEFGTGVTLDISKGSVVKITTPVGIVGITGQSKKVGEISSFTAFIDGNAFWQLPSNLYFEENEDYFSCGVDIANFSNIAGEDKWYVTFASKGHDTDGCSGSGSFGSCCYDEDGETQCRDFVDQRSCEDDLGGSFRPFSSCEEVACDIAGDVCCSNGICLEYVSKEECEFYHGTFWTGVSCGTYAQDGPNYTDPIENGRFCYDPCLDKLACCKDGLCLGEYSRIQCEEFLGGFSVEGECGTVDCCSGINYIGACCRQNGNCEDAISSSECNLPDVFHGHGSRCADINCCSEEEPPARGFCCVGTDCEQRTEEECEQLDGHWGGDGSPCPSSCIGNCCLPGGECTQTTRQDCAANNGIFGGEGDSSQPCSTLCSGRCCKQNGCDQTTLAECNADPTAVWMGIGQCSSSSCGGEIACCDNTVCTDTNQVWCDNSGGTPVDATCNDTPCNDLYGACCSIDSETGLYLCSNKTKAACEDDNDNPNCWKGGEANEDGSPVDEINGFKKCQDHTDDETGCDDPSAPFFCGICNDIDPLGPMGCCHRPTACQHNNGLDNGQVWNYGTTITESDWLLAQWDENKFCDADSTNPYCQTLPIGVDEIDTRIPNYDTTHRVFLVSQWHTTGGMWANYQGMIKAEESGAPHCTQIPLFECCGPPPYFPYCGPYTKAKEKHPDFPRFLGGTNNIKDPITNQYLTAAGKFDDVFDPDGDDPQTITDLRLGDPSDAKNYDFNIRQIAGRWTTNTDSPRYYLWPKIVRNFFPLNEQFVDADGRPIRDNSEAEDETGPDGPQPGGWNDFTDAILTLPDPTYYPFNRPGAEGWYNPEIHNTAHTSDIDGVSWGDYDFWVESGLPGDWKIVGMPESFYTNYESPFGGPAGNGAMSLVPSREVGGQGAPYGDEFTSSTLRAHNGFKQYVEHILTTVGDEIVENNPWQGPSNDITPPRFNLAQAAGLLPSVVDYYGFGTINFNTDWDEDGGVQMKCGADGRSCSCQGSCIGGQAWPGPCQQDGPEGMGLSPVNCFKYWKPGSCKNNMPEAFQGNCDYAGCPNPPDGAWWEDMYGSCFMNGYLSWYNIETVIEDDDGENIRYTNDTHSYINQNLQCPFGPFVNNDDETFCYNNFGQCSANEGFGCCNGTPMGHVCQKCCEPTTFEYNSYNCCGGYSPDTITLNQCGGGECGCQPCADGDPFPCQPGYFKNCSAGGGCDEDGCDPTTDCLGCNG